MHVINPCAIHTLQRMKKSVIVAPSLLAADQTRLLDECQQVLPATQWFHIDIMDGYQTRNHLCIDTLSQI